MINKLLLAGVVCGLASASFAMADPIGTTETFNLTVDGCTGGCGTGSTVFGTIKLEQTATGVVSVTETLNSPSAFVATGAGNSLVFSIAGDPAITIGDLTSGFKVNTATSTKASPFTSGEYSITCSGLSCGPGASTMNPGPLSFTVTDAGGINLSDFAAVDSCYKPSSSSACEAIYFSSDISGVTGNTGDVGALAGTITTPPPSATPEPSSLMMLGSGMLGLAGVVRRRFGR